MQDVCFSDFTQKNKVQLHEQQGTARSAFYLSLQNEQYRESDMGFCPHSSQGCRERRISLSLYNTTKKKSDANYRRHGHVKQHLEIYFQLLISYILLTSVCRNFSSFQVLTCSFHIKLLALLVSILQFESLIEQCV